MNLFQHYMGRQPYGMDNAEQSFAGMHRQLGGFQAHTGGGMQPMPAQGMPNMHISTGGGLPAMVQGFPSAQTGGGLPPMQGGMNVGTGGYDAPHAMPNAYTGGGMQPQPVGPPQAYTGGGFQPQQMGGGGLGRLGGGFGGARLRGLMR